MDGPCAPRGGHTVRTDMGNGAKNAARRREARRQRASSEPSFWRRFRDRYGPLPVLITLGLWAAATAVILWGGERLPYRLDQQVPQDVRARVSFQSKDEKLTEDKRREARLRTPNVYVRNDALLTSIRSKLTELFTIARSSENVVDFVKAAEAKQWNLGEKEFTVLKAIAGDASPAGSQMFESAVENLTAYLAGQNVVEKAEDPRRAGVPETSLLTWGEGGRRHVATSELLYTSDPAVVNRMAEGAVRQLPAALDVLREPVRQLILQCLSAKGGKFEPIYRYDAPATGKLMEENESAVPEQINVYKAGDLLLVAGKRITAEELALLKQEHKAYLAAIGSRTGPLWRSYLLSRIGVALTVLLVACGLASYTAYYAPRIARRPLRAIGLTVLLLGMLAVARVSGLLAWKECAVFPVVMAAAVLSIVYEQRYAFGLIGGLAVLATIACGGGLGAFITLLTPMTITVFLLRDVRTRSKLISTGALAALGAMAASLADGLTAGESPRLVLWQAGAASLSALLAGFIVLGVLPAIERVFGVATSITLLEWCDASRPLLRRLAQEAPGTHSHSLVIGTLAEKAAEAIGANGLLVRVGAMFHDIGKIAKPEYYVENQEGKINRHDRLGPTLSHLVIVAHVKDGLELAREYGLPKVLHQFIAEHHGTTVVKYFHRAAVEQAQRANAPQIPESEFRYPGPRPQTRESAILMLCDGVEGAVRALPEPTPGRIESTVHQVLLARLNDGQFDDCDITMKELSRVEEAVVKALCAAYHGRIAYPKDEAGPAQAAKGEVERHVGQEQETAA